MVEHDADSASDSGVSGDWEQLGSPRTGEAELHEDGSGSKKGGKKDLSHVACRFYRVGACTAGASCPFSHTAREPGQTTPVCKWFQKGSCKFGHKCANAHIMPGDPPSMDWKNKKAAKAAQQTEGHANGSSQVPSSPGSTNQGLASSPPAHGNPPPGLQQPVSSGLSSMFGGRNGHSDPATENQNGNGRLSASSAEQSVAAIGMSPVGLPLPADMALPTGKSITKASGTEGTSVSKPKLFSYASVVGASSTPNPLPASSPNTAKAGFPSQISTSNKSGPLNSPSTASSHLISTSPSISSVWTINPASPSFVPRGVPGQALGSPSTNNGLSSSVPSALNVDKLESYSPSISSHGMHPQNQQQIFASGSYQRTPHQPSPLAPPPLQHSHSHSNSIPSRSFLSQGSPSLSPSFNTITQGGQHHHRPPMASPGTSAFGTSPFGNNAIFLSTSHEEDAGSFMARASRAPGVGRGISPARGGFEQPGRGSIDASSSYSRNKHGSSALADDDEDGTEDDKVLEEELVPSSLKHLLTPMEKARRDSRSGAIKSGFFNPFNNDTRDDDDDDEDDFDQDAAAGLGLRYSQSVPSAATAPSQFNRAPGSPPTFVGYGSPFSSGLVRPADGYDHAGYANGGLSSNLSKHLLVGGAPQGHHVERGFMMADQGASDSVGSTRAGGNQLSMLGSSLPQGMAAGLSRLHMIPAGSEHTGYTPPASFTQSPSARSHLSGAPPGISNPATSSSNTYLAPGNAGRSAPGSSYGIKLPSLLQHPGAGSRKVSANHYESTQVHVGSPLARTEIHSHIGSARDGGSQNKHHEAQGHASSDAEDEDLVFDMDV